MREDVYKAPWQTVFSSEFRRSKQWRPWCDARRAWIDTYLDENDDEIPRLVPSPADAHLEEMSETTEWGNAPWGQAKERRENLFPPDERDDVRRKSERK